MKPILLRRLMPRDRQICDIVDKLQDLSVEKSWKVEISEEKSTRSDLQNNYLNGVCYKLIGDAIGYERDEVSEFLCGTYFGWKDKRVPKKPSCRDGIESVPIRTTTRNADGNRSVLGKTEFSEYVSFCQRFAASKGIHVPDPDPDFADHREQEAVAA